MKKLKVLLLNPPTAAVSTEVLLSLAYISAVLRKAGHQVMVIDATAPYRPFTPEQIDQAITGFKPDFIGLTLTIVYIAQTYDYLKQLRKHNIPIIAGGCHPNSLPEEVLENGVDIVAVGEGEETVVELADYFLGNRTLHSVAGLCYKDKNEKISFTAPRPLIKNLDVIPFPDFTDFPIRNYTGSNAPDSNPIFWSIFTSRGCPFDCIFCSSHNVFGRTIRLRSPANIVEEIKSLSNRFGAKNITFQDDEILCSKNRFLELCDLVHDSKLKIKMSIRTRIDSIDEEILIKAKKSGLTRISFGIESWNDDTLEKINKKYTVKTIQERFKIIEKTEFPYVSFNNIWGFPWENNFHLRNNVREINRIPKEIHYFTGVAMPLPYPKTKLYEMYNKEYGFTKWWLDAKKHPPKCLNTVEPFFKHFASTFVPLYTDDFYWFYPKKTQKMILAFTWQLFRMFTRRHYNWLNYMLIIVLSRISYLLWKISPRLEQWVFYVLGRSSVIKLKKNIQFIDKY